VAARSKGMVLRPLVRWDCGFESRRGYGCRCLVSVVCCQVEISVSGWSLVQRSPTECCVSKWVWSWSIEKRRGKVPPTDVVPFELLSLLLLLLLIVIVFTISLLRQNPDAWSRNSNSARRRVAHGRSQQRCHNLLRVRSFTTPSRTHLWCQATTYQCGSWQIQGSHGLLGFTAP
jgi:hypothetical protein